HVTGVQTCALPIYMARKRVSPVTAFDPGLLRTAAIDSLKKIDLRRQIENPVMFSVDIGAILTTLAWGYALFRPTGTSVLFIGMVSLWLWLTVLFSNLAESLAEARGKARAASLRRSRTAMTAKRIDAPRFSAHYESVASTDLKPGDLVLVQTGDLIPSDGDVVAGAALVNEAAITGESAPVVRESGGDRSAVTGGTTVIANE